MADIFIIAISGVLTNFSLDALSFKIELISVAETPYILVAVFVNVIVCICMFAICGAYKKMWRYFNAKDYLTCIIGMVFGTVISTLILSLRYSVFEFVLPYTVISSSMAVIGVILFRFIFKCAFLDISNSIENVAGENTLIVDCGNTEKIILLDIFTARRDENNETLKLLSEFVPMFHHNNL